MAKGDRRGEPPNRAFVIPMARGDRQGDPYHLLRYFIDGDPRHLAAFFREGGQMPDDPTMREIIARALETDVPRAKASRFKPDDIRDVKVYLMVRDLREKTGCTVPEACRSLTNEFPGDIEGQYSRGRKKFKKMFVAVPIS